MVFNVLLYKVKLAIMLIVMTQVVGNVSAQFKVTYFEQGRAALGQKNYLKAIEYLNYTIAQSEYNYEAFFCRGIAKYNLGDLIGAENDYTKCIDNSPYHKEAFHYRAIVRDRRFNFEQAFLDYDRAIGLDSTNWRVYVNRSVSNLFLQKFKAAVEDCNSAIKLKSTGEGVYIIRGICKTGLEDFDEALNDFEIAILKNPRNMLARIQRGACYAKMNRPSDALVEFEWVLQQDPNNTQALFQRAVLRMDNREFELALSDLDKVVQLSPSNTNAIFNRAILKSQMNDFTGALSDYDAVVKKHPDNVLAYYNRAGVKMRMNDFSGAILDYDKTINLNPEFTDAYNNRAQAKQRLNDFHGAERDAEVANILNTTLPLKNDSLKENDAIKFMKLMSLSGDLPDKKDQTGKVQYENVVISAQPYFLLSPFKNYKNQISSYDAGGKAHYEWPFIGLVSADDSLSPAAIEQALLALDEVCKAESIDAKYVRRATLYTYQENFNKAFSDFNLAIAFNENNLLSYFGRANARLKLRELFNEFETASLTAGNTSTNLSVVGYSEHSYKEILADFDKVIELDPKFAFAYYNRSYVKSMNNDFSGALADLNKAIELKPDMAVAYFNRGLTNIFLEHQEKGCTDMSMAGELGLSDAYNIILRYCE